jgi:hypothetical protein
MLNKYLKNIWERNYENLTSIGIAVLIIAAIAGTIYLEIGVWQECRATNSWFYCMRVLSK